MPITKNDVRVKGQKIAYYPPKEDDEVVVVADYNKTTATFDGTYFTLSGDLLEEGILIDSKDARAYAEWFATLAEILESSEAE